MRYKQISLPTLLLCLVFHYMSLAQAADAYNSNTGVLSIPLVKVGETFYTNVEITLSSIVRVGTASSNALSYDTYNSVNNQLSIPTVNVGSLTYSNVVVTVGNVIKVGATCASLEACTGSSSSSTVYYSAAPFSTAIQASIAAPTLTNASTITNRNRYLISNSATANTTANYLQIG